MAETKIFPTAAVLSTITGVLVSEIGSIYEVLNWMTGESVFTHQLPRIRREAAPVILAAHPHLREATREALLVNTENWQAWRDLWIDRYGDEIAVPKMSAAEHQSIDPLSELAETVHPSKIIIVEGDIDG